MLRDPLKTDYDLPHLESSIEGENWLPFTKNRNTFKNLNLKISDSVEYGSPRPDYCAFWIDYVPTFRERSKYLKMTLYSRGRHF